MKLKIHRNHKTSKVCVDGCQVSFISCFGSWLILMDINHANLSFSDVWYNPEIVLLLELIQKN